MKSTAKLVKPIARGPSEEFIRDEGWAIAAPQHRAGREPGHLTVSRPYGRPSHIAIINTRLFTVRSHKPPIPFGHRQWIGDKR